ncbi:MAG: Thiosulfate sulfurtransferase PspE precursor [Betaproteobacteria bacterium ADurb.Bin341]|nr:MAG: Thiosulfate sulfurtransferase PspE precursor [Betaproteobacteria bacterium ADurb.Bin341]
MSKVAIKGVLSGLAFLFLIPFSGQTEEIAFNGTRMQATIIDVRMPQEFAAGHITGALNIPVERIESAIGEVKGLSKESPILLYCRSGRRSAIARVLLERQGYRNVLDGGGIESLARSIKICTVQQPC